MKYAMLTLVLSAAACADAPDLTENSEIRLHAEALAEPVAGQRFELSQPRSRFDVGDGQETRFEGGFEKIMGSRGIFATYAATRSTLAVRSGSNVPRRDAREDPLPRGFTSDPDESNKAVRAYFLELGIPESEIAGMHVTTTMAGSGPMEKGFQPLRSEFLWHTSHVERALAKIPVEGSYAYAAFDDKQSSIHEGVYWPDISKTVVTQALSLQDRLSKSDTRATYLRNVAAEEPGADAVEGEVKIVHTGGTYEGEFTAAAVYAVILAGSGKPRIRHFDAETGKLMVLPDEVRPPAQADSGKKR